MHAYLWIILWEWRIWQNFSAATLVAALNNRKNLFSFSFLYRSQCSFCFYFCNLTNKIINQQIKPILGYFNFSYFDSARSPFEIKSLRSRLHSFIRSSNSWLFSHNSWVRRLMLAVSSTILSISSVFKFIKLSIDTY